MTENPARHTSGQPLTRHQMLGARVIDAAVRIDPERIRRARAGKTDSRRVGILWTDFVAILDALEAAFPGALKRTRELMIKALEGDPDADLSEFTSSDDDEL